jgi:hypothetical protein
MDAMDRLELGVVIAERHLEYNDPDSGMRSVQALLGSPVESVGGGEWYCPWRTYRYRSSIQIPKKSDMELSSSQLPSHRTP